MSATFAYQPRCTATWGVVRPGPGDSLYCVLPEGHSGLHHDDSPTSGGGDWADSNPWAEAHDGSSVGGPACSCATPPRPGEWHATKCPRWERGAAGGRQHQSNDPSDDNVRWDTTKPVGFRLVTDHTLDGTYREAVMSEEIALLRESVLRLVAAAANGEERL